ncbi:MAG: FAD-dependent oxidoreductase [Vicinamibacterales bacterium]
MTTEQGPGAGNQGAGSAPPRRRGRWWLGVAALVAFVGSFPIRKAAELAADPVGEKDCGPEADPATAPAAAVVDASRLPWSQRGGTVNDASCLNRTPVHGIVQVGGEDDVRAALVYARDTGRKVSIAGVRHSMGGQAFAPGVVLLDMRAFNHVRLDAERRVVTVGSGATWHDIQLVLHPRFAVQAMQSTDIFSVGGSISVNAHGMDHRLGSVGTSVRSMRVMLADGTVRTVSRDADPDLFRHVVGGYGLFGVILEAELDVVDNAVYTSERRVIDYRAFDEVFSREIRPDPDVRLLYGHLSTSPGSLLSEMLLYTYRQVAAPGATLPPLGEVRQVKLRRLVFNLAKRGPTWMRLKWFAEKYVEPRLETCTVTRNEAMGQGEACLVSRNDPMHDSVPYLRNALPGETDILHEYFIPRAAFVPFVDGLRAAVVAHDANLLNASVRVVHREDIALSYAPGDDMLAVVLYLNQPTTRAGTTAMAALTSRLIDLTAEVGGRFFLPYQLHYSAAQLRRSYPEIDAVFAAKRRYDPEGRLTSTFYERFAAK